MWRKINYNFLQSACKRCRIHLDSYPQALEHVVFQHDVLNRLYQNKITELKGKGLRLVPMKNLNGGQDKTAENDEDQEEIDDVEECKCFYCYDFFGLREYRQWHCKTLLAFS